MNCSSILLTVLKVQAEKREGRRQGGDGTLQNNYFHYFTGKLREIILYHGFPGKSREPEVKYNFRFPE